MTERETQVTRLLKRGLNHYALGDVRAAIAAWEDARELDPENQALHDYLEAAYDEVETGASTRVAGVSGSEDDLTPPSSHLSQRGTSASPSPQLHAPAGKAAPARDDEALDSQVSRALTAYKSGQLRDALRDLQRVADVEPERLDVQGYLQLVRSELAKSSAQEIGDKGRVVALQLTNEQLMKLRLTPEEGFLLSQIDGTLTIAELLSLSSVDRVRTLEILARLLREGIIA